MKVLSAVLLTIFSACGVAAFLTTGLVNGQTTPPKQAVAPATIIADTIADMPKGTQVVASPEALVIDDNKKVWLNKHQPVGGDNGIIVYYMADGTYEVEIKDDKLKWLKVPLTDEIKKSLVPVNILHLPKPPVKK